MLYIFSLQGELSSLWSNIQKFFTNIWDSIKTFALQYLSETAFNVLVYALIVLIILFIILAVMNRNN